MPFCVSGENRTIPGGLRKLREGTQVDDSVKRPRVQDKDACETLRENADLILKTTCVCVCVYRIKASLFQFYHQLFAKYIIMFSVLKLIL